MMKYLVIVAALAGSAHADALVHADGGVEALGSADVTSVAFRAQLLLGNSFGSGRVRPELAAGALVGDGTLYAPDPRAVDGAVGLNFMSFGPELQAGLQFYRGDEATTRLFASFAYMHVSLDNRLMIDPVPGVGGNHGTRATVGVNFARAIAHMRDRDAVLYLVLPQQLEVAREDDGGSTRYGVTVSWGS
jgi:hypothetical protein